MFDKSIIPLAKQPAYQEAMAKVVEIGRALTATTAQLDKCRSGLLEEQNRIIPAPSLVDRAMALAGGSPAVPYPPLPTVTTEISRLEAEQRTLQDGLRAANDAAEAIEHQLGREMGSKAKASHVAAVKKILSALEELCRANLAEEEVRNSLQRLGYHYHGLEARFVYIIGQIDDQNGSPAYYYAQEARKYLND